MSKICKNTEKRISHKSLLKNTIYWTLITMVSIAIAIGLRIFVFASFKIPTPSMEPAIAAGDYILVNKQIPGPRLISNFFSRKPGEAPETKRYRGFRKIKRNDVLVFNFPYEGSDKLHLDLSVCYVKRCVAIPGDTFYIENGIYKVRNCTLTLGNDEAQRRFARTPEEMIDPGAFRCFPYDSLYNWNVKNFGPLYLPRQGDTIQIDAQNIVLYRRLIEYETGKTLPENLSSYIFRKNYYFMAGDLVYDSRDSRYWGLLPEDHIVGKASFIWKSEDMGTGKYRWERFFKRMKNEE